MKPARTSSTRPRLRVYNSNCFKLVILSTKRSLTNEKLWCNGHVLMTSVRNWTSFWPNSAHLVTKWISRVINFWRKMQKYSCSNNSCKQSKAEVNQSCQCCILNSHSMRQGLKFTSSSIKVEINTMKWQKNVSSSGLRSYRSNKATPSSWVRWLRRK